MGFRELPTGAYTMVYILAPRNSKLLRIERLHSAALDSRPGLYNSGCYILVSLLSSRQVVTENCCPAQSDRAINSGARS